MLGRMSDATAVRVRGLRKRYRGVTAVDGVDLDVGLGEVVALLGPNGAGKTTTVEILEGFRDRDAGEVRVLGEDPRQAPVRWRRGIGVVLQEVADVGELTVAETVRHFARYYPGARDPDETIALVDLVEKAGARVSTLSGGQRRRLDVAIGVVGNPRLLFLDEPTTGFDPQARRRFWSLIRSLADPADDALPGRGRGAGRPGHGDRERAHRGRRRPGDPGRPSHRGGVGVLGRAVRPPHHPHLRRRGPRRRARPAARRRRPRADGDPPQPRRRLPHPDRS
jgi:ABC-type branched-subunit amino acid transport system ATPase component